MDTKQTSLLKVLAEHTKNFCLEITESGIRLKQKHSYYKQVQGGMAITRKPGCDFDAYTYFMNREDIHIEIIFFDPTFWQVPRKSFLTFISMLWFLRYQLDAWRGIPMYPNIFFNKWLKIITPGNDVYRFKNYTKSWLGSKPSVG